VNLSSEFAEVLVIEKKAATPISDKIESKSKLNLTSRSTNESYSYYAPKFGKRSLATMYETGGSPYLSSTHR
jgi:hypothetical protein